MEANYKNCRFIRIYHSAKTRSTDPTHATAAGRYPDPSKIRTTDLEDCFDVTVVCDEDLAAYQALVEHVDIEIETILNGMDDDVLDDTVILVMGDNGTPYQVRVRDQ